jgi:hypothetical protein
MEWNKWVGKIVFVKLDDGQFFSNSKILTYEEPFMSLTDKYGLPAVINVNHILKIREEEKCGKD